MDGMENGLSRRGFIDLAGAAAAMTLISSAVAGAEPSAGELALRGLAAWLHTGRDGTISGVFAAATDEGSSGGAPGAPITLTQATPGTVDPMWSWQLRQQAIATARTTLLAMAASQWGVAADQCRCDGSRIMHPASGRVIGCRIWVAIA